MKFNHGNSKKLLESFSIWHKSIKIIVKIYFLSQTNLVRFPIHQRNLLALSNTLEKIKFWVTFQTRLCPYKNMYILERAIFLSTELQSFNICFKNSFQSLSIFLMQTALSDALNFFLRISFDFPSAVNQYLSNLSNVYPFLGNYIFFYLLEKGLFFPPHLKVRITFFLVENISSKNLEETLIHICKNWDFLYFTYFICKSYLNFVHVNFVFIVVLW